MAIEYKINIVNIQTDDLWAQKAFYRHVDELTIINPKLILEENQAGSFTCTIPYKHPQYNNIELFRSYMYVYRNDDILWIGRVRKVSVDLYKNKQIECEGLLTELNDILQSPACYEMSPYKFTKGLIQTHHISKTLSVTLKAHYFTLGKIEIEDNNDYMLRYTNYDPILECLKDKVIKQYGGHIDITYSANTLKHQFNLIKNYKKEINNVIRFGENILDFSTNFDETDICTVLIPLGVKLDEAPYPALEAIDNYLDIRSVHGTTTIQNMAAIKKYGVIEKTVHWDDVTIAQNLYNKGYDYIMNYQYDNMQLELSVIDLSSLGWNDYEPINVLDQIRVISEVHGLNKLFPVTKLELTLNDPSQDRITLGANYSKTLTEQSVNVRRK